jgi:hypothetical protein
MESSIEKTIIQRLVTQEKQKRTVKANQIKTIEGQVITMISKYAKDVAVINNKANSDAKIIASQKEAIGNQIILKTNALG